MAVDEKLVVLADEVYQANIWKKGASFSSFKKVRSVEMCHGSWLSPTLSPARICHHRHAMASGLLTAPGAKTHIYTRLVALSLLRDMVNVAVLVLGGMLHLSVSFVE